ncbi:hypothetical protein LDENG_00116910, partial [Lucifuga dentata]
FLSFGNNNRKQFSNFYLFLNITPLQLEWPGTRPSTSVVVFAVFYNHHFLIKWRYMNIYGKLRFSQTK